MKKAYIIIFIITITGIIFCQDNKTTPKKGKTATMVFTETEYDYGKIPFGGNGIHKFQYKNTGKEPLLIIQVKSSCGCTTPTYTREPIKKNKTGIIEVKYNTKIVGKFSKSVTVTSNADNSPITLRIKGEVEKAPATAK